MADPESVKKTDDEPRQSRTMKERTQTEDRVQVDSERLEMFRSSFFREALPDLPSIPGYHTFWATTTNPRDTVAMRLRLGYEIIKAAEYGGPWLEAAVKQGSDFAGGIMVNEMLALKIPLHVYQQFMLEAHHYGPNREQEKLTDVVDAIQAEAERRKARVEEEEGMKELRRTPAAPIFGG